MARNAVCVILILSAATGCHPVYVDVDCRLARDDTLRHHLDGPDFTIRGPSEQAEASLAFQEFSGLLARALELAEPALRYVPADEPADLQFTLGYRVVDRGTGLEAYPVYAPYPVYGYCGPGYYYGPGCVGSEVRTVHLGYHHMLFVTAWIPDKSQPAGQRVIWECRCDQNSPDRSLKQTMPYLLAALVPYYGQSTERPIRIKFDPDDDRVRPFQVAAVGSNRASRTQPAQKAD